MRRLLPISLAALALVAAGCGSDKSGGSAGTTGTQSAAASADAGTATTATTPAKDPRLAKKPKIKIPSKPSPSKLVTKDLIVGTGPAAKAGDTVSVQYVGVLYKSGKQFDASWDRGEPFSFPLGAQQVIPGWDQGVAGMRVGGRRELIIPARLAYGSQGSPPTIPPNAPLIFVVDLEAIG